MNFIDYFNIISENLPIVVSGLIFFFCGGFVIIKPVQKKLRCTVEVEAVVDAIVYNCVFGVCYSYWFNGREYKKYPTFIGGRQDSIRVGDPYCIKIDPDRPSSSYSEDDTKTILFGILFMVLGLGVSFGFPLLK